MIRCNMCGKDFNTYDEQEGFGFDYAIGYGSHFDGDNIRADFCCECFDSILLDLNSKCKVRFLPSFESFVKENKT